MPILVIFSCAAGLSTYLILLVPYGLMARVATIGLHVRLITYGVLWVLVAMTFSSVPQKFTHRGVRTIATSVSPSAALVLY